MQNGPKCNQCGNLLTDLSLKKDKGIGICPVGQIYVEFQADPKKRKKLLRINSLGQYEQIEDWQEKSRGGNHLGK